MKVNEGMARGATRAGASSRRSPSPATTTSGPSGAISNATPCAPASSPRPSSGAGRVWGCSSVRRRRRGCTPARSRCRRTGWRRSTRSRPRRSWLHCGGASCRTAARAGNGPRPRSWGWRLRCGRAGVHGSARQRTPAETTPDSRPPFSFPEQDDAWQSSGEGTSDCDSTPDGCAPHVLADSGPRSTKVLRINLEELRQTRRNLSLLSRRDRTESGRANPTGNRLWPSPQR